MTTIRLPMPPSVNNLFFNKVSSGGGGRAPTPRYAQWQIDAGWQLKSQHPPKFIGPVRLEYRFNESKTKADLSNLVKAPEDLLVTHNVIEDDRGKYVRDFSARWAMGVDECEITIISLRHEGSGGRLEYVGEGE